MNVILFGAGASFGSGQVNPCPPPLGNNLYKDLKRIYPLTWGSFDSSLQSIFVKNFEDGMGYLIEHNNASIPLLMQQMAIFFARFYLNKEDKNYYIELIRYLKSKNILKSTIISTLNYECICEIAAINSGVEVEYFGNDDSEKLKIWKIHGSCNFKLQSINVSRGVSFNNVGFEGNIEILNLNDVNKTYRGNTSLYPSMCLYAPKKPLSIAPGIINKLQKEWAEKVINANKIFVIGVRINEIDEHIWKPISESNGMLYYVGENDEFIKWTTNHRNDKVNKYLGNKWAESNETILSNI